MFSGKLYLSLMSLNRLSPIVLVIMAMFGLVENADIFFSLTNMSVFETFKTSEVETAN